MGKEIQLIANTPLIRANTTIRHIHMCSVILIVNTSSKVTLKFL
jgi:hypothetical protein